MPALSRLTDGAALTAGPYVTASVSPTANSLILLGVVGWVGSGTPTISSVIGGGMTTWTQVNTLAFGTARRVSIYRAMQLSPGSGAITITWNIPLSGCAWYVHQWTDVSTAGSNGSGAIVQNGTQAGTSTSTSVALAAFASALNYAHLYCAHAAFFQAMTAGTGMTAEGNIGIGDTTFSDNYGVNQPTPSGSWASSVAFGSIALEIAAPPTSQLFRPDADMVTTGWTTAPLYSKLDEVTAGGDVITATAS